MLLSWFFGNFPSNTFNLSSALIIFVLTQPWKFLETVQRRIPRTELQKSYNIGLIPFIKLRWHKCLCWGTFKADVVTRLILVLVSGTWKEFFLWLRLAKTFANYCFLQQLLVWFACWYHSSWLSQHLSPLRAKLLSLLGTYSLIFWE